MIEYIYFIKCPSCPECHDEHFYYFDEAKARAMNFLSHKPIITQVEADYNDFHECTNSCDLGTVWSWEDLMKDVPADPEQTIFTKTNTIDRASNSDPEFDALDSSFDSESSRKQVPVDMTVEQLVEEMEENEDTVECKVCEELHDKTECHKDPKLGWVCESCNSTTITEDTSSSYQGSHYFECYDHDNYLLEYQKITITCYWEEVHDGISMYEPNVIEGEDEVTLPYYGFIVSIHTLLSWLKDVAREPSMVSYTVDHVSDDFDFDLFEAALEKHKVALFNHFYDDAVEQAQELYDSGDERVVSLVAEANEGLEESLKEAINPMEMVELEYPELTATIYGEKRDVDDWDEVEHTTSHVFLVPKVEVATAIWENWITEEDVADVEGGLDALEDDTAWEQFLETHFDSLFEKYQAQILEYFKDEATEDFRERSQEEYQMDQLSSNIDRAYDEWRDEKYFGESKQKTFLEEFDDAETHKANLVDCPECGTVSYDMKEQYCTNCGLGL